MLWIGLPHRKAAPRNDSQAILNFIHGAGRRRTVLTRNDNRAFPVNVKAL
jgi:hypothetical protein